MTKPSYFVLDVQLVRCRTSLAMIREFYITLCSYGILNYQDQKSWVPLNPQSTKFNSQRDRTFGRTSIKMTRFQNLAPVHGLNWESEIENTHSYLKQNSVFKSNPTHYRFYFVISYLISVWRNVFSLFTWSM